MEGMSHLSLQKIKRVSYYALEGIRLTKYGYQHILFQDKSLNTIYLYPIKKCMGPIKRYWKNLLFMRMKKLQTKNYLE